ncbi:MAG: hypothetical protein NTU53_15230, partial [Planctomycetota bacterium]|nr:hypothetical protein [Planctomycetota bacterium]
MGRGHSQPHQMELLEERQLLSSILPDPLATLQGSADEVTAGLVVTDLGKLRDDQAMAILVQADGRIVAAGATMAGGSWDFALVRYHGDGTLDGSFGFNGRVCTDFADGSTDGAFSLVLQPDGKIVAAGYSASHGSSGFALARYNDDGSLDPTFGSGGLVTTAFGNLNARIAGMALQADGKLVVAGTCYSEGVNADFALARYNLDGTLDGTYGSGGKAITDFHGDTDKAYGLAIDSQGRIVVAGSSNTAGGDLDFALARYDSGGRRDPSFGWHGMVRTNLGRGDDEASSVAIQSDGGIAVGGYANADRFAVVRYLPDGSLDASFASAGKEVSQQAGEIRSMAVLADGSLLVAGRADRGSGTRTVSDFGLGRYDAGGSLVSGFGGGGIVTTDLGSSVDGANAMAVQEDGKIILAGFAAPDARRGTDLAMARYNADGTLDTTFSGALPKLEPLVNIGSGGGMQTMAAYNSGTSDPQFYKVGLSCWSVACNSIRVSGCLSVRSGYSNAYVYATSPIAAINKLVTGTINVDSYCYCCGGGQPREQYSYTFPTDASPIDDGTATAFEISLNDNGNSNYSGCISLEEYFRNTSHARDWADERWCVSVTPLLVSMQGTDTSASEMGPNTGTLTVRLSGAIKSIPGDSSTCVCLWVPFTVSGTATAGDDYVPLATGVTFPIDSTATTSPLTITPKVDWLVESTETVKVTLTASTFPYRLGSPNNATVNITDQTTGIIVYAPEDPGSSSNPANANMYLSGVQQDITTLEIMTLWQDTLSSLHWAVDRLGANGQPVGPPIAEGDFSSQPNAWPTATLRLACGGEYVVRAGKDTNNDEHLTSSDNGVFTSVNVHISPCGAQVNSMTIYGGGNESVTANSPNQDPASYPSLFVEATSNCYWYADNPEPHFDVFPYIDVAGPTRHVRWRVTPTGGTIYNYSLEGHGNYLSLFPLSEPYIIEAGHDDNYYDIDDIGDPLFGVLDDGEVDCGIKVYVVKLNSITVEDSDGHSATNSSSLPEQAELYVETGSGPTTVYLSQDVMPEAYSRILWSINGYDSFHLTDTNGKTAITLPDQYAIGPGDYTLYAGFDTDGDGKLSIGPYGPDDWTEVDCQITVHVVRSKWMQIGDYAGHRAIAPAQRDLYVDAAATGETRLWLTPPADVSSLWPWYNSENPNGDRLLWDVLGTDQRGDFRREDVAYLNFANSGVYDVNIWVDGNSNQSMDGDEDRQYFQVHVVGVTSVTVSDDHGQSAIDTDRKDLYVDGLGDGSANITLSASISGNFYDNAQVLWSVTGRSGDNGTAFSGNFGSTVSPITLPRNDDYGVAVGLDHNLNGWLDANEVDRTMTVHVVGVDSLRVDDNWRHYSATAPGQADLYIDAPPDGPASISIWPYIETGTNAWADTRQVLWSVGDGSSTGDFGDACPVSVNLSGTGIFPVQVGLDHDLNGVLDSAEIHYTVNVHVVRITSITVQDSQIGSLATNPSQSVFYVQRVNNVSDVTLSAAIQADGTDYANVRWAVSGTVLAGDLGSARQIGLPNSGPYIIFVGLDHDHDNVLDTPGEIDCSMIVNVVNQFVNSPPTITGGTIPDFHLPDRASIGSVTPSSPIRLNLGAGQSATQTVEVAPPQMEMSAPAADVFLLFDDTGSFDSVAPSIRQFFAGTEDSPSFVAMLQQAFPAVSFGFGVGRFEDYLEADDEDQPFILNQPIITPDMYGFAGAMEYALSDLCTTPGGGNDIPESIMEALYQVATGAGFDGDGDGSATGSAGDILPFRAFAPSASQAKSAGTIGGAGFRPGALHIILLATDSGTAYMPDPQGPNDIGGLGGVTIPLNEFLDTDYPALTRALPKGHQGATIQKTIDALNAIGAQVIGLGALTQLDRPSWTKMQQTDPQGASSLAREGMPMMDPSSLLKALAKATGTVSHLATPINNGTNQTIGTGDPLYFQVSTGSGVAAQINPQNLINSMIAGIATAVADTLVDVDIVSSDPQVGVTRVSQDHSMPAGIAGSIDIRLTSDGATRNSDIILLKRGTKQLLGAIPVCLNSVFTYQVQATDADQRPGPLTYNLTVSKSDGTVMDQLVDGNGISSTGLITWHFEETGSYFLDVRVSDGEYGVSHRFTLSVTSASAHTNPTITLPAKVDNGLYDLHPYIGQSSSRQIGLSNPDGSPMHGYLYGAPDGMNITDSGVISWTPTSQQVGLWHPMVVVVDENGGRSQVTLDVLATVPPAQNRTPRIVSEPLCLAQVNQLWGWDLVVRDDDPDRLTFSFVESGGVPIRPAGMTLDSATGSVTWFPSADQLGQKYELAIRVSDLLGTYDERHFWIDVLPTPPVVGPAQAALTETGSDAYKAASLSIASADDPNGTDLTYTWQVVGRPSGQDGDPILNPTNGSGRTITAMFRRAGVYRLYATVTRSVSVDGRTSSNSSSSYITVTVPQEPRSVGILPEISTLHTGASKQFYAFVLDQFGDPLPTDRQPEFAWSTNAGTITDNGTYTASEEGSVTITATASVDGQVIQVNGQDLTRTINVDVTSLAVPASFMATDDLVGRVRLSWDTAAGVALYALYRRVVPESGDPEWIDVADFDVSTSPPPTLSYTDWDAPAGRSFYLLYAVDSNGAASSPAGATGICDDGAAPQSPRGVAATGYEDLIALSWTHNTEGDLAGYRIYSNASETGTFALLSGENLIKVNRFDDTTVTAGQRRFYQIAAVDLGGHESDWSTVVDATRISVDTLAPPAGLDSYALGPDRILIRWQESPANVSRYDVYRNTVLITTLGPDRTSYIDTGLSQGVNYSYEVAAIYTDGSSRSDAASASVSDGINLPGAPGGAPTAAAIQATKISLHWNASAGGIYHIYRADTAAGPYVMVDARPITITDVTASSYYTDTGLHSSTSYYYKVVAVSSDGDQSDLAQSTYASVTTIAAPSVAPIVQISEPADVSSAWQIRADTLIMGTIEDPDGDLQSYTVQLEAAAGGAPIIIVTGDHETGAEAKWLGTLRPTSVSDGAYKLVLTASDGVHGPSRCERDIEIKTELKLDNFTLPVTDLTASDSGIPITISRVYDTQYAGRDGVFGPGWRMELPDVDLRTTALPLGKSLPGFRPGDLVYITLPGGQQQVFMFDPKPDNGNQFGFWRPAFTAVAGTTSALTVSQNDGDGQAISLYPDPDSKVCFAPSATAPGETMADISVAYNPAQPAFGGVYTLTTRDGLTYVIDAKSGMVRTISDLNGNSLTFRHGGITSSSGRTVTFTHDTITTSDGATHDRITQVWDSEGPTVGYVYDGRTGDLVGVQPPSIPDNAYIIYEYIDIPDTTNRRFHYLTSVTDARGVTVLQATYDPTTGKLKTLFDAQQNKAPLSSSDHSFQGTSASRTVTDPAGNVTEFIYDSHGSVIREIRQVKNDNGELRCRVIVREYTYHYFLGTLTSFKESKPLDAAWDSRRTVEAGPDDWQTAIEYASPGEDGQFANPPGSILSQTDALGRKTTYMYEPKDGNGNQLSKPIKITDPFGNATEDHYDDAGNVVWTKNALGEVVCYTYVTSKDMDGPIDPPNGLLKGTYRGHIDPATGELVPDQLISLNTYYNSPQYYRLQTSQDASGVVRYYEYQLRSSYSGDVLVDWPEKAPRREITWSKWPSEADYQERVETITYYDYADRAIKTCSGRRVNAAGTELAAGISTLTTYNEIGQVGQTTDEHLGTTSHTYDTRGQLIRTVYPDGTVTMTVYDSMGRAIWVLDRCVPIDGADDGIAEGNATHTWYDSLGRVWKTERASGVRIRIIPDPKIATIKCLYQETLTFGRVVENYNNTIFVGDLVSAGTVFSSTQTEYNTAGQVNTQTGSDGQSTTYGYYADGRVHTTTNAQSQVTTNEYDLFQLVPGGTIEVGDQFQITLTDVDGDTTHTLPVSIASGHGSLAQVCIDLAQAINDCTILPFDAVTAVNCGGAVRIKPNTVGTPIFCTVATTESNGAAADGQTFIAFREDLVRDARGNETGTASDALGRTVRIIYADGSFTETQYLDAGQHVRKIEQRNAGEAEVATDYYYDIAGRLTSVV